MSKQQWHGHHSMSQRYLVGWHVGDLTADLCNFSLWRAYFGSWASDKKSDGHDDDSSAAGAAGGAASGASSGDGSDAAAGALVPNSPEHMHRKVSWPCLQSSVYWRHQQQHCTQPLHSCCHAMPVHGTACPGAVCRPWYRPKAVQVPVGEALVGCSLTHSSVCCAAANNGQVLVQFC